MTSPAPRRWLPIAVFIGTALTITALDLWTKKAVFDLLRVESIGRPPRVVRQEERVLIPGCFSLQANYNYGAFSGWFSDHTDGLTILSAVALVALALFFALQFRAGARPGIAFTVALAFLWGGTLGNLHDRYTYGAVRDFIKWFIVWGGRERVWPNFNIADSAICTGVGLWIVVELLHSFRQKRARRVAADPDRATR